MTPEILVRASRTRLSGIGGFLGVNESPQAELHARLLDAEVVLRVKAATQSDLLAAETAVSSAIVAADPGTLRAQGVLRMERITDRPDERLTAADGLAVPFGIDLRFAVRYEYRPVPVSGEGTIGAVEQGVTTAMLEGSPRLLYASEFLVDPLADFTAVAGSGTGTPGAWSWDAPTQEIRQTGTRTGGANGVSGNKVGTYLLLNAPVVGGPLADFALNADVRSDGTGGIGMVFRYQNTSNFGFVLLEQPPGIRLFGKRVANVGSLLTSGGVSTTGSFTTGQFMRLRLLVQQDRFELAINGITALSGWDSGLPTPGMVGFFCRRNATARFRHLSLRSL